jgi:hypothetical protein
LCCQVTTAWKSADLSDEQSLNRVEHHIGLTATGDLAHDLRPADKLGEAGGETEYRVDEILASVGVERFGTESGHLGLSGFGPARPRMLGSAVVRQLELGGISCR